MSWIKVIFHVHTIASFDSIMTVRNILKYCNKNSIDILVITDHDSMEMSRKANLLADNLGVIVIPAIEYITDAGDIIGMFVEKICESKSCEKVLHSIREQGGISVLSHPMKGHNLKKISMEMVDIIETKNSRCTEKQNEGASELSRSHNKPELVGSDAHFPWELGLAVNYLSIDKQQVDYLKDVSIIKNLLLNAPRRFYFQRASQLNIYLSQFIKGIKKKNVNLIYSNSKNMMTTIIRRTFRI